MSSTLTIQSLTTDIQDDILFNRRHELVFIFFVFLVLHFISSIAVHIRIALYALSLTFYTPISIAPLLSNLYPILRCLVSLGWLDMAVSSRYEVYII